MRFRLRPGEDGSCLNLYKPTSPRIIAPARPFVDAGGFRFAASMAENDAERQQPVAACSTGSSAMAPCRSSATPTRCSTSCTSASATTS